MRLWIDGQCFQTASKWRGIGRYVQEWLLGIIDNHPDVELLVSLNAGMPQDALAARDHLQQWLKPANIFMWHGVADGGEGVDGYSEKRRLSEIALAYHVACINPDIAVSASPFEGMRDRAVPLVPNDISSIPVASIFYDAIPYRYPEQYLQSSATRACYERRLGLHAKFDLNLCISDYSRRECIEISENAHAINMLAGISKDFKDAIDHPELRSSRPTPKRFVLYVGGLDWRKNVESAIAAFAQLPEDLRTQYSFVLAGDHPKALLREEEERWRKLGLPQQDFAALGHVTDSQLVALYKEADLAIQPSLLEGFGLTALEAMTCGTLVIASNTGALPEVIGDREFLFNPADVADIARVMRRALSNREAAKTAAARQQSRASDFSWAKTAAIAVTALKDVAGKAAALRDVNSQARVEKAVLQKVEKIGLPRDFVSEVLARSEIPSSGKPRLIVDATSTYRVDHKTGIQRVVKNICANLPPERVVDGQSVELVVAYSDSLDGWFPVLKTLEKAKDANAFSEDARLQFGADDRILMLDSSWEFFKYHYKTLHAARLRGATIVSCLYDTVPLRFPGFCDPGMSPTFSVWFQAALAYSNAFICISKAVADELITILEGIRFPREMKIGYWHLGADFNQAIVRTDIAEQVQSARHNFLMVGTLEPRKGYALALDALERLWDEGRDVGLTIVGKQGWGVEHLIRRIKQHREYGERLFWLNGISDEKLQQAYAGSDALIAASYAEGFGLPIVEAAHFGKAVIASDIPVFREVTAGGQNCQFFTSGSSESLAAMIRSFLDTAPSSFEPVTNNGISWKESAEELQRIVLTDDWYRIYAPGDKKAYVPITDMGDIKMAGPLVRGDTRHKIELIEGPIVADNRTLKYIVRVTNLSPKPWASAGTAGDAFGVAASYRVLSADGDISYPDNDRSRIPFVLPPGDSLYLGIEIPSEFKRKGAAFAEIGLFQESAGWWSNPLQVPL
ncbi:glycosyltransferase family 4 protein [Rhizobium tropici]|uniref:Glycosyltransferase family 4 protein n=1 Tax=Rhizobium tropici TaxID=398 RepID=A0A5B0VN36_RHITR|nr:glycosyltransferase family 1 protein [Rhizobium tropici]KAA1175411.1 glycosyltransferase family 4 protein [Rhizobium tropici]